MYILELVAKFRGRKTGRTWIIGWTNYKNINEIPHNVVFLDPMKSLSLYGGHRWKYSILINWLSDSVNIAYVWKTINNKWLTNFLFVLSLKGKKQHASLNLKKNKIGLVINVEICKYISNVQRKFYFSKSYC